MTVDEVVEEFLAGRQWLRCGSCGVIGDARDDETPDFRVVVDGDRVVELVCADCG